jgi:ubiquinone/menaquinone biosynthesis C-methylase UbiE
MVAAAVGATDPWAGWVLSQSGGAFHAQVRDRLLDLAEIRPGERLLDVGCGDGLIGLGALGRGARVIFSDVSAELVACCRVAAPDAEFLVADAQDLDAVESHSIDIVTTRSVLIFVADKPRAIREFRRVLKPGGRLVMFEPINRFGQPEPPGRFWGFDLSAIPAIAAKLRDANERLRLTRSAVTSDFDERDLVRMIEDAGFAEQVVHLTIELADRPLIDRRDWLAFLATAPNPLLPTFGDLFDQALTAAERAELELHLRPLVESGTGRRRGASALACARA